MLLFYCKTETYFLYLSSALADLLWKPSLCTLFELRPPSRSLPHAAFRRWMSKCDAEPETHKRSQSQSHNYTQTH